MRFAIVEDPERRHGNGARSSSGPKWMAERTSGGSQGRIPGCISTCVEAGWGLAGRCRGESAGRFDAGRQRVGELSVDRLVKRRADGEKGLDGVFQYVVRLLPVCRGRR